MFRGRRAAGLQAGSLRWTADCPGTRETLAWLIGNAVVQVEWSDGQAICGFRIVHAASNATDQRVGPPSRSRKSNGPRVKPRGTAGQGGNHRADPRLLPAFRPGRIRGRGCPVHQGRRDRIPARCANDEGRGRNQSGDFARTGGNLRRDEPPCVQYRHSLRRTGCGDERLLTVCVAAPSGKRCHERALGEYHPCFRRPDAGSPARSCARSECRTFAGRTCTPSAAGAATRSHSEAAVRGSRRAPGPRGLSPPGRPDCSPATLVRPRGLNRNRLPKGMRGRAGRILAACRHRVRRAEQGSEARTGQGSRDKRRFGSSCPGIPGSRGFSRREVAGGRRSGCALDEETVGAIRQQSPSAVMPYGARYQALCPGAPGGHVGPLQGRERRSRRPIPGARQAERPLARRRGRPVFAAACAPLL